jgi:hypothetical protein
MLMLTPMVDAHKDCPVRIDNLIKVVLEWLFAHPKIVWYHRELAGTSRTPIIGQTRFMSLGIAV